jgi:CheY-like chemotaxis protein
VSTSALVVGINARRLFDYNLALTEVFDVVYEAATFAEAKTLLLEKRPDVLVADVRLEEFNGIHLVLWSQMRLPQMGSVIIGESDPVLERDAHAAGAAYIDRDDVEAIVEAAREVLVRRRTRRWPRKHLAKRVAARIGDQSARVLDVSYGGFCVETDASFVESPAAGFTLDIPEFGVRARATCKWTTALGPGWYWCGAEVVEEESRDSSRWRRMVDALPPDTAANERT